jgi:hypothetical protein
MPCNTIYEKNKEKKLHDLNREKFYKIQHPLVGKTVSKLGKLPHMIKDVYEKSTANSDLMAKE